MYKKFRFKVDAIDVLDGQVCVNFTVTEGFHEPVLIAPQMRVCISDIESKTIVYLKYEPGHPSGSYIVDSTKLKVGETYSTDIRTHLNPFNSKDAILSKLNENPDQLMIKFYPHSVWIVQDISDEEEQPWVDEISELVTNVCLVAELLKSGELELDGRGVVKLRGYAKKSIHRAEWWCDGVVGVTITINDCIQQIHDLGLSLIKRKKDYLNAH